MPKVARAERRGWILLAAVCAVILGGLGWALYVTDALAFATGSRATTLIIVAGVLVTGLLTGVLMWLAFYSARRGFDESPTFGAPAAEIPPPAAVADPRAITPERGDPPGWEPRQ